MQAVLGLRVQVIFVPILAGLSGHGVRPLTWAAAVAALVGVGLLEGDGSPPVVGDLWSFLSAIAFGVQVRSIARFSAASTVVWSTQQLLAKHCRVQHTATPGELRCRRKLCNRS